MADIHAFDISASLDMMEVKNAIETTKKEIGARFDFKGIKAEIELNEKDKIITLLSSSESKIDAIKDVLLSKFIKRGIEIKALKEKTRESAGGGNFRLVLSLNDTSFQMIQFMLTNLSRKACQGNGLLLPLDVSVAYCNLFISGCWSYSCQRQATFLGLVRPFKRLENGIKHNHRNHADIKNNDTFLHPNHISC